jgi:nitroreductase
LKSIRFFLIDGLPGLLLERKYRILFYTRFLRRLVGRLPEATFSLGVFCIPKEARPVGENFLGLLNPNNQRWAEKASVLILFVSKKTTTRNGEVVPSKSHSFDTGAAWQNLSLQAILKGWHTHGIGGFDREKARVELKVPDDFQVEAVVAIGKQGEKSALAPELQEKETPNNRLPLKDLIFEGGF